MALALLRGYKLVISPLFTGSCRFLPSCSDYAAEAIRTSRCASRHLAGAEAPCAVSSVLRRRSRPGASEENLNWNAAFSSRSSCRSWCSTATRRSSSKPAPKPPTRDGRLRRRRADTDSRSGSSVGGRRRRVARRARPPAAASARPSERDVDVETPHVIARLHQPRRAAQKLAAEGLPRSRTAIRSNWSRPTLRATQPLPFSLRVADAATTATLNGALYAVQQRAATACRRTAQTLTFEYRDATGLQRHEGRSASTRRRTPSRFARR